MFAQRTHVRNLHNLAVPHEPDVCALQHRESRWQGEGGRHASTLVPWGRRRHLEFDVCARGECPATAAARDADGHGPAGHCPAGHCAAGHRAAGHRPSDAGHPGGHHAARADAHRDHGPAMVRAAAARGTARVRAARDRQAAPVRAARRSLAQASAARPARAAPARAAPRPVTTPATPRRGAATGTATCDTRCWTTRPASGGCRAASVACSHCAPASGSHTPGLARRSSGSPAFVARASPRSSAAVCSGCGRWRRPADAGRQRLQRGAASRR